MAKIANVALTNTFDTWRTRSNEAFDRLSQFAIKNSSLYANTITANNVLKATGNTVLGAAGKRTIVTGLLSANGRVTVGTNLAVTGNTTIAGLIANGALGTSNYVLRTNGTSVYWAPTTQYLQVANAVSTYQTKAIERAALANTNSFIKAQLANTNSYINTKANATNPTTSGLLAHTGRATVSTSFLVSGNTVLGASGKKTVINGNIVANTGTGSILLGDQTSTVDVRGAARISNALTVAGNTTFSNTSGTNKFFGTIDVTNANYLSQTLTDGATISWNTTLGSVATVTLGGNRTFAAPTPLKVGTYILHVIQDGTGSRTITWNAVFKWTAAVAPVLTTTASRRDIITFICDGTNMYGSYMPDVR
jgi:hypothetical protein